MPGTNVAALLIRYMTPATRRAEFGGTYMMSPLKTALEIMLLEANAYCLQELLQVTASS